MNAHERKVHLVASLPNTGVNDVPNVVKVRDCNRDAGEENAMGGTVEAAAAGVQNIHRCAVHGAPCPTRGDARLMALDDPSPFQGHLVDLFHVHRLEEIVGTGEHSVVQAQQAESTVPVGREIERGLGETQREMGYEVDEPDILRGGCGKHEDRQGFVDEGQVGAGANSGGQRAHGWGHHGLVRGNDPHLSLAPKVFEVAYGGFRPE